MNNKITLWLVTLSLIWFSACHKKRPSKVISKPDSIAAKKNDSAKIASTPLVEATVPVTIKNIVFDYLTAKSKFSFQNKTQELDNTNVNIRMKKDSLIWISVTGIGFEVARGVITRDSIVFMDKIHKDYFVFNYTQLSKLYNFNITFPLLQSIIIGNLPFEQKPDSKFYKDNEFFLLKQKEERFSVDNFISASNSKLTRLHASEAGTTNTFSLNYDDFKDVNSFLFPFSSLVQLNVKSPKDQKPSETIVKLKHSKVELVSQSPGFPFSIPSSYKRKK